MEKKREFPKVGSFLKMVGPSFLVLAMGLGSGEIILWPYLVSQYGLGIAWGAFVGITLQFFINMEIERYALVKGESVFVGLFAKKRYFAWWFIVSTFVGFGLPGIVAASAKMVSSVFSLEEYKYLAILFLIVMGILLTFNKSVYEMMERVTKVILIVCVPLIFLLVFFLSRKNDWQMLIKGLLGFGEGYRFLPKEISIATFLAAFAYSGAGGNLNLTQSIYIKEKGYGMGKFSQKLAGLLRKNELSKIKMTGEGFEKSENSIENYKQWWRVINIEHFLVFWGMGLLSMLLLMLLAYVTTHGRTSSEGINFVIDQSIAISAKYGVVVGKAVLFTLGLLLFQTQLGILDSTSRIMGENLALLQGGSEGKKVNLSKTYFIFVWSQILFGSLLFLLNFKEPRLLIVAGAVINAFSMLIHIVLVRYLNRITFTGVFGTSIYRQIILWLAIIFFAFFFIYNLYSNIF